MSDEDTVGSPVAADDGTDLDSDPVEEVDSDEEFSRLMKTPSSQRGERLKVQNSSTPQTRHSPTRRGAKQVPATTIAVSVPADLRAGTEPRPSRAEPSPKRDVRALGTADSQQTQPVAPLTASQLDRLMDGLSDIDEEAEINSSSENEPDETRQMLRYKVSSVTGTDSASNAVDPPGKSQAANQTVAPEIPESSSSPNRAFPVVSSPTATNRRGGQLLANNEARISKPNHPSSQISNGQDEANITPGVVNLEVIDETPLKLSVYQDDVYLLVRFGSDSRWWPCQARYEDWRARSKRASVLFREDETGVVNLTYAFDLQVKPGDSAHVMKRQGRFQVEKLSKSSAFPSALQTTKGANVVTVSSPKRTLDVAVADLYFTDDDMHDNLGYPVSRVSGGSSSARKTKKGRTSRPSTRNGHGPDTTGDTTGDVTHHIPTIAAQHAEASEGNGSPSAAVDGTLMAPRHTRSVVAADPPSPLEEVDASVLEIRSSPVRRRKSPLPEARSPWRAYKMAMHEIDFDSTDVRSPPRKRRDLTSRSSALRQQNPQGIFGYCMFSISVDSSKPEARDGTSKSQMHDLIVQNGGRVLKDGLSEVIALSEIDAEGSMPDLVVHDELTEATFAAVVTDEPRRTVKYLEMVALGWPCLHSRYIVDCVEQGKLLDWLPYLLPAGISSIPGKRMTVNANVYAFHVGWLQRQSLAEQIRQRKVVIKCCVPFCILVNARCYSGLLLLATLCAPQFRTWIYTDANKVPEGSLLVDLTKDDATPHVATSSPPLIYQLQNYSALNKTEKKNKEWMIQCIISGNLV